MADGVAAPLAAVSLLRRPLALVPCLIRLPATQRDESSRAALVQRQHISTAAQLESRRREQRQRGRGEDGRGAGTGAPFAAEDLVSTRRVLCESQTVNRYKS